MIKKAARQLLDGENKFTEKFDDNKKILGRNMPSKPLRNKIAGYIARLIKMRRLEAIRLANPQKAPVEVTEEIPSRRRYDY